MKNTGGMSVSIGVWEYEWRQVVVGPGMRWDMVIGGGRGWSEWSVVGGGWWVAVVGGWWVAVDGGWWVVVVL